MIKTSWKKSLVVAGVLTALCASAAFAAEQPAQKPSMRERTNAILHHDENSASPDRPYHMERGRHWGGPMHPGPQLTDEQVKEREARRAEWEKLPPEQRKKAYEEERAKWREERMKNMTPEEKERFEQREAKREEWRKMTPEQRQKAREEARAKWDSMSESEKEAAREHFRTYYHGGDHYYEGHRKYRHHKGENRGDYYRDGYHNRGEYRGDCPNTNCPW
ncbi:DUF3106 domain-containing protein [Phascolarctobacterium faecium]|uniref:DUF3106 domain-containing protein n=1 Tax=Phascolarctobacterium faecium TaxID=33025 RepID=UPI003FEF9A3E